MRLVAISLLLACLLFGPSGCQRDISPDVSRRSVAVEYGALPAVRASHHRELRREIARLDKEHATPIQLDLAQSPPGQSLPTQPSCRWVEVLKPMQWLKLQRHVARLVSRDNFGLQRLQTREVQAFADENDVYRRQIRQIIAKDSAIPYVCHCEGLLADLSFIDVAHVYLCWEQIYAARMLQESRWADVVQTFAAMFEIIERLARTGHLVPRLEAAQRRQETWTLWQEMVDVGRFPRNDYKTMQRITDSQLATWPKDSQVWIADRAQALHAYEMIRDGHLTPLTKSEISRFREAGIMERLLAVTQRIDGDEYYYLRTMRRVIQECELPYYERRKGLQVLYREQRELRTQPEFPAIAVHLFLSELDDAQRQMALDRALCEAWQLGFALLLDPTTEMQCLNSMTGELFVVSQDAQAISIWGAGEQTNRPVRIPRWSPDDSSQASQLREQVRQR